VSPIGTLGTICPIVLAADDDDDDGVENSVE
jgi:hypothetical protein